MSFAVRFTDLFVELNISEQIGPQVSDPGHGHTPPAHQVLQPHLDGRTTGQVRSGRKKVRRKIKSRSQTIMYDLMKPELSEGLEKMSNE